MMVFYNSCNIMDGLGGWKVDGVGVGGVWEAEGGQNHLQGGKQWCCFFTEIATINLVGQDSCQQQFDTPNSLISVHQWLYRLCSGPSWTVVVLQGRQKTACESRAVFCRHTIYSLIVGMSG